MGSPEGDPSGIDLTPLLDVVFIMLIFFLVTANFIAELGLPLRKGEARGAPEPGGIVLSVMANGFTIDGESIDVRSIPGRLLERIASKPDASVSLAVSPQSNAEQLVKAMDAARSVGIHNLPIAALPDEEGAGAIPAVDSSS